MKLRLPKDMASISVEGKTYEPDEHGDILVENHEHVPALLMTGAFDPVNIVNPAIALATLSAEDASRLQDAFVPVDEKKELEDMAASLDKTVAELVDMTKRCNQFEADLKASEDKVAALEADLKASEEKVTALEAEIAAAANAKAAKAK